MRCLIVIPARMGATRFPGKPLVDLLGKPMVQWVYEAAKRSGVGDQVLVATPDQEIVDVVEGFGGEAILTRHDHVTGTDRIAEVAEKIQADVYVNVQGDEPLILPESIAACTNPMFERPDVQMASIYSECPEDEFDIDAVVKVVTDLEGFALYFSRHAIPYARNARVQPVKKHVGLYAYRRGPLQQFSGWPMSALETAEGLEQLRFMEHGIRISMSPGSGTELAIDLPEQVETVRALLRARGSGS